MDNTVLYDFWILLRSSQLKAARNDDACCRHCAPSPVTSLLAMTVSAYRHCAPSPVIARAKPEAIQRTEN